MLTIIVGCGRMGGLIANDLSGKGESVIIIDRDEDAFIKLTGEFSGFRIVGDATQVEILRQAKIEKAQILLALTGDDNINLTIAQVGKHFFNVPHTFARVFDPVREPIFRQLGIQTICPTRLSVNRLLETIDDLGGIE